MKYSLSKNELSKLKALLEICREGDLLDLPSYDSISRSQKINDAWEALKIIESILTRLPKDIK